MMRPHLRARMPSITGRVTLKQESRLVQMTSRHCSELILWKVVSRVMPALLTRMSTGPSCASTARTIASASSAAGDVARARARPRCRRHAAAPARRAPSPRCGSSSPPDGPSAPGAGRSPCRCRRYRPSPEPPWMSCASPWSVVSIQSRSVQSRTRLRHLCCATQRIPTECAKARRLRAPRRAFR